ncbi:MAG: hypothetical protein CL940_12275 [Deltaproteobacteria bacterium]|nr:hypothetical protein [Deltaproteobacteria bacterium]
MKGKQVRVIVSLLVAVSTVGFLIYQYGGEPAGLATGSTKAQTVWNHMEPYTNSYLKAYDGAFDEQPPTPIDVLEAFNELGYSVTGPGGFWRTTVPNQWMGCQVNGELPACHALKSLEPELKKWDAFQEKINGLSPKQASRFLAANHKKMVRYLKTYVPAAKSETGMKATALYTKKLASAFETSGAGSLGDGDDL